MKLDTLTVRERVLHEREKLEHVLGALNVIEAYQEKQVPCQELTA